MADYEARVGIDFDVTQATAALQRLQQQISAFQSALGKGSAASAKAASNLQRDLLNNINATGKFAASMTTVSSSAENFTRALENNKLSLGQYFRYAGASTKTFGRFFKGEFDTINKVVRERVKTIQTQFIKMGRDSNGALQAIKIRPLALDLQNYGTQAQMAAQRQAVFNQLIKQGSTNLLNFGKNTQWAGRQLMVGFTIPLSIMGATAVKEFEKIEKQAIRFKRVYGDAFSTTAETDEALASVRELAKEFTKYGLEVEKTIELAADAAQMGLKGVDLLAQVTEATRLAVLGEVEQQEALETSISLTNAFGISAEELANKINFLNAVENETVTAISDLTTAIPKAGPVIQQLGGSVEDLAFFLTAMKEGGINASEGANALKSGLAKIINPTEKASQMLGGLGINIRGIVEANAGDIKSTVLELADALDSLDPLNRARAIEELFGRFQFARISTLFQNIVKEGSQAERVLKLSKASAEELAILSERELARVEDSPLFKFQKQIEQLQAALAPLGEEFLKAITPIIEFAKGFLDNFNNMSDGAKRFAVVATTVIAGIGPIALMTFGLIANGVANLIKMFAGIGRMFSGFGQKTTDLGLQTQYLTNEQLESQAAAISMGQAHGQLTQILTSETAAVSQLAAAYNTMTAAQRRAAAMQGVKLPGPSSAGLKKYAKGIVSVPGPKGAGDIVPAMLSPGEAVIPARQSQKYAGLINGMINDTIPGFSKGGIVKFGGKQFNVKTQSGADQILQTIAMLRSNGVADERILRRIENLVNRDTPSLTATKLAKNFGFTAAGKTISRGAGKSSATPDITKLKNSFAKNFAVEQKRLARHAQTLGMSKTQIADALNVEAAHLSTIRDSQGKKIWAASNLVADLGYVNRYVDGFSRSADAKKLMSMTPDQLRSLGIDKGELRKLAAGDHPTSQKSAQTLRSISQWRSQNSTAQNSRMTSRLLNYGLDQRFKSGFYSNGMQTLAGQKAGVVGSSTGAPKPSGVKRVGGKPADNRMVAVSKGETILSQKSTNALRRGRFSFIPGLGVLGKADGMPSGQSLVEQRVDSRGRTYYYAPGKGRVSAAAAQQMMAQQSQGPQPKRPKLGAGGIGMAAGMGAMAYSMTGGPGADIAGMASLPLMMLPQLLPMLMNPIGAVVTGLVAAGGAFLLINKALNDTGKKARELASGLGVGSDAMEKYSEFAGTVSATELRDRQRAAAFNPFSIQAGKNEFGANFLQSESGSQLLSTIKSAGGFAASGAALSSQLQAAVSSGSLSVTQARSVAYAIAEQLGDQSIGMDINAKLTQLFGPNGENLINEPLKIQIAQIATTETNLEADYDQFIEATNVTEQEFSALAIKTQDNFRKAVDDSGWGFVNIALDALSWLNPINWVGKAVTGDVNWNVIRASGATIAAGFESAQMSVEATNAYIVKASNAIQNYQSAVDALDVNYDNQIRAAEAAGDEALAQELINRKAKERNELMNKYAAATRAVREQFEASSEDQQRTLLGAAGDRIKEKFAEDTDSLKIYEAAVQKLEDIASAGNRYELSMLLNADAITLNTFDWIANNLSDTSISRILNLETKLTGKDLGTMTSLLSRFGSDRTQQEFIAKFELATDAGQAQEVLSLFTEINNLADTLGGEKGQDLLDFYVDPKNAANAELLKDTILGLKEFDGDKITIDYIQNIEGGEEFAKIIKGNQQYFDSLDKEQQIVYTQVIATIALSDPGQFMEDAIADAASRGQFVPSGLPDYIGDAIIDSMMRGYANRLAEQRTRVLDALGLSGEGEETATGGTTKNPLDEIFERLQRVRNAAVGATRTVAKLIELMSPGTNTSTFFRGIDQKLLLSGYGREFIDAVMGMDEQTRSAFVKIENGVVKVTSAGKALNKAFSEIALGDFQLSLLQGVADTNKQITALNTLVGAGMSSSDAMEIVSDSSLAYAIATATTTEEVAKLISEFNKLQAAQRNLNFQTKEGTAAEFSKLYDKAVGFLEAQKATINAQFEIDTNVDQDIIRQAQNDINALNFELDDYQAELFSIEEQEDEVNKRYDDRLEALDKIQAVNEEIARQEQANLAIADAVAAGDIAAAARALRDKQREEAAAAAKRRQDAIEKAREVELSKIVSDSGRTREQIDERIRDIQREILDIEEKRLEPAQERIRLIDVENQEILDAIDDQIDEWNLLSAKVNESKLKLTPEEMSAMEYQAKLIEDMLKNWDDIEDKEATLKIIKKTYDETPVPDEIPEAAPTPDPGPTPAPAPTPSPSSSDNSGNNVLDSEDSDSDEIIKKDYGFGFDTPGNYPGEVRSKNGVSYTWNIARQKWEKPASTTAAAVAASQAAAPAATASVGPATPLNTSGSVVPTSKPTGNAPKGTKWSYNPITSTWSAVPVPKPSTALQPGYYWEWSFNATKWYQKKLSTLAGSLVGTTSPSAGEANRFANLAPATGGGGGAGTGYMFMSSGGMVPKYFVSGGYAMGTDTIPAMLTPGEFVMRRHAVSKYGTDMLKAINSGTYGGDSMYNYSVSVNVKTDANPEQIARAVMTQIKSVESQKIRGNRF